MVSYRNIVEVGREFIWSLIGACCILYRVLQEHNFSAARLYGRLEEQNKARAGYMVTYRSQCRWGSYLGSVGIMLL